MNLFSIRSDAGGTIVSEKATMSIAVGSGTGVGVSVAKGAENYQSMLNSSLHDILAGNFVWYGSDIAFVIGTVLSVVGIGVTLARLIISRTGGADEI
ncbi:hypothetical protein VR7878_03107 [Vibrio ruber DSM 16370]|uniref:Uncharacterized protein n=1 Tax=Vibrio ruber (strain DSM 16370 / JCM 11486 / BCRC 17186 / CECT 7878 / LMG 23124 / VR1) TaxID=1123498 RepID=A0A1R4LQN4_VIBR1|nr:hypothetical protein [Vibrio ruber]SJN58900.1 hypothetical protein VR7878_03107 [Vibrio ruber DSM 16370]